MGAVISRWIGSCFTGEIIILNGRRLKLSPLNEGGFSVIFLAEDTDEGEVYALKKMTCVDPDTVKEAIREAELYKLFDHPNLIKCIDSCVIPSPSDHSARDVYMLLPLYKRGTLQDLIDENKERGTRLPESEILHYADGIAKALHALHTYKPQNSSELSPLAHRDVKPANVLLGSDDTPILMDFGSVANAIVKIENRQQAIALQDLAAERCTMPFRAPELFDVKSNCIVTGKVDVWSLGCTIYALTYGNSPFEYVLSETGGSLALAILNGKVTFPQSDHHPKVRTLLNEMLKVNPDERPDIEQVLTRIQELRG